MKREDLPIPSPCNADWNTMTAAGRKRFCADCKKHVHDLSKLTEPEAQALLAAPPSEGLCVRYIYNTRGDVMFQVVDTSLVPASNLNRAKAQLRASALAVASALAATSATACMGAPLRPARTHTEAGPVATATPLPIRAQGATAASSSPVTNTVTAQPSGPVPATAAPVATEQMRIEMGEYAAPPIPNKPAVRK
jgi:hypothetical protein